MPRLGPSRRVFALWDDVRSPEWAELLPIGVEAAHEAKGEERGAAHRLHA